MRNRKVRCIDTGDVFINPAQAGRWASNGRCKNGGGSDVPAAIRRNGRAYGKRFEYAEADATPTIIFPKKNADSLCWECNNAHCYSCTWFDTENQQPVVGSVLKPTKENKNYKKVIECPNFERMV